MHQRILRHDAKLVSWKEQAGLNPQDFDELKAAFAKSRRQYRAVANSLGVSTEALGKLETLMKERRALIESIEEEVELPHTELSRLATKITRLAFRNQVEK